MITLAIPTYNRTEYLFESFSNVISNDKIKEIAFAEPLS